jgi:hypothetical protein
VVIIQNNLAPAQRFFPLNTTEVRRYKLERLPKAFLEEWWRA